MTAEFQIELEKKMSNQILLFVLSCTYFVVAIASWIAVCNVTPKTLGCDSIEIFDFVGATLAAMIGCTLLWLLFVSCGSAAAPTILNRLVGGFVLVSIALFIWGSVIKSQMSLTPACQTLSDNDSPIIYCFMFVWIHSILSTALGLGFVILFVYRKWKAMQTPSPYTMYTPI